MDWTYYIHTVYNCIPFLYSILSLSIFWVHLYVTTLTLKATLGYFSKFALITYLCLQLNCCRISGIVKCNVAFLFLTAIMSPPAAFPKALLCICCIACGSLLKWWTLYWASQSPVCAKFPYHLWALSTIQGAALQFISSHRWDHSVVSGWSRMQGLVDT